MNTSQKRQSIILRVITSLFCQHGYNLINQYELESEFDIVVKAGKVPNTWNCQKRRLITDYKCSKCGKIKRLTATTPH